MIIYIYAPEALKIKGKFLVPLGWHATKSTTD